jgi:signal peptidase II
MPLAVPVWQSARRTSTWVWFAVAASSVMTDQLAKFAITRTFAYGEQVEVSTFFNIVHVLNPGAAFSFLANAGGWQRYFLMALGLVVSAWLGRMHWPAFNLADVAITIGALCLFLTVVPKSSRGTEADVSG